MNDLEIVMAFVTAVVKAKETGRFGEYHLNLLSEQVRYLGEILKITFGKPGYSDLARASWVIKEMEEDLGKRRMNTGMAGERSRA